jgi:AraC family transcriptional regulator, regulatory protein of adaptative response / methylated-DNA-[protein]-cysteine methyltransferase
MESPEIKQAEPNAAELYASIESAIHYLAEHSAEQPDLETVAMRFGLSPWHFQRVFKRMAGISPKRFLQHTTLEQAKALLRQNHTVLDTAYEVGLSGAGRLHDLFIQGEAVTPGTFKRGGEGLCIRYGIHPSPFGYMFIALTPHGICELDIRTYYAETQVLADDMRRKWPQARMQEDSSATGAILARIVDEGQAAVRNIPLHLRGTNFQLKVWQALLRIPEGERTDYSTLALAVGAPKATRAVGSAVGDNPIAYLIPCHRVLRKDGGIGGYATGVARKQVMLACEAIKAIE